MRKIIIFILMASMLLYGCKEEVATGPSPYIEGDEGIVAEFEPMGVEESGIYEIYEDETFPIQIILKNKGEYDIQAGEATVDIQGILLSDFSGISSGTLKNIKEIEGISTLNDEGTEDIIDFGQKAKYTPSLPGTFYDANVFARVTYKYVTQAAVPKVCFKENLRDDSVCDVDESKTVYSSAAPIQVTSATERIAGAGLIGLDFEIQNKGDGRVTISGQEFSTQYDQLSYVLEPSAERSRWECTSAGRSNEARLVDGKATIRCRLTVPLEEDTLFTKQIGLTLTYDYRDVIQETVRIKRTI